MKSLIKLLLGGLLLFFVTSCIKQEGFTESIFVDEPELDPNSATYKFDKWLNENYLKPYNVDFRYKLKDVNSDITYNLVPTSYDQSINLAIMIKYMWFDIYGKVVNPDFLKYYGVRIIQLIGSQGFIPGSNIVTLGTADGGIEVTMYNCNALTPNNLDLLNEECFHVLHHEFGHILQQQKTTPAEFTSYSAGAYDPQGWYNKTPVEACQLGFVSPYASSAPTEDWVEVISYYIIRTDNDWQAMLNDAKKTVPPLTMSGDSIITLKLGLCRKYLSESWGVDIDAMHQEFQARLSHVDDYLNEGYAEINGEN